MTKKETAAHNTICLNAYMTQQGILPEDRDKLPFWGEEIERNETPAKKGKPLLLSRIA